MIYYMAKVDVTSWNSKMVYGGQLLTSNEFFKEFKNVDLPYFIKLSTSPKNTKKVFGVRKLINLKQGVTIL